MKTIKTRFNFATNSSSSHSLVRLDENFPLELFQDSLSESTNYGWEFFSIVSLEEKLRYVATAFSTCKFLSTQEQELLSQLPMPLEGIDHESLGLVGNNLQAAIALVSDPRVAILGGHDNVSYPHHWIFFKYATEVNPC